jgi:hypothetical protein
MKSIRAFHYTRKLRIGDARVLQYPGEDFSIHCTKPMREHKMSKPTDFGNNMPNGCDTPRPNASTCTEFCASICNIVLA